MQKQKLTDFFKTDYVNYSSYDNLRKIASLVDGQKNSARKILCTVLDKNIKNEIKVSQLGSKVSEYTEYLHGSLDGVITGLAQNFAGKNNLALLVREGNFGTRFSPDPSASRYIFTHGSDEFFNIFNKEDTPILEHQKFEGHNIEPRFYLPTLPLLLINGSEGVSSGFAQKILPRSKQKMQSALVSLLKGKKPLSKLFVPHFEGFEGTVEQGASANQWLIKGVATKKNSRTIEITEIPVGYSLKDYIKVLDKLEDGKVIRSYKDKSDNNKFHFEVLMDSSIIKNMTIDEILVKLKLVKTVSENYTCLDENNKIVVCSSALDILEKYVAVKLPYLEKRKAYKIDQITQAIQDDNSKYIFISNVISGNIVVNKKSKAEIISQLDKFEDIFMKDNSYDYLLRMPIYSLTKEKVAELEKSIKDKQTELNEYSKTDITTIWLSEI